MFQKEDDKQKQNPKMTYGINPESPSKTKKQTTAPLTKTKDTNPKKKKNPFVLIGAAFGGLALLYMVFAFLTIGMAEEGKDFALTKMFGMQAAKFLNTLVTGIHIVILLIALGVVVWLIIALFKMMLAKKDQLEKKKSAKKHLIISGVVLFVILVAWITAFVYLEGRRDVLRINIENPPILTEPEDTLQLTGPVIVKFDATYAPVNSDQFQILSYDWDFGDEEAGTSKIVTHEYKNKGRYDVILTITKRLKLTAEETKDTYSKTITVTNQELAATFKADPQSGEAPLMVQFDASDSVDPDGKIDTYEWDLDGDGVFDIEYDDEVEFEYEYTKLGLYEVTLRVTSLSGDYNIAKKEIVVGMGENPEAVITVQDDPQVFEKGVSYIFRAEDSTSPNGDIVGYEWDFGDGSDIETTKTVSHEFEKEGVYQVILKVTDEEDEEGESLLEVILGEKPGMPKAMITTTPAIVSGALSVQGELPLEIDFDGGDSTDFDDNIVDYEWDFDDDGKADAFGKTATHLFTEEGTFTVELTVVDAEDNYDSTTVGVKVLPQGMKAILNADPLSGEVPMTVSFDASASYHPGADISSYQWDFGDGTNPILGSAKINHKYTEIGEYAATVTVIGTDNAKDDDEVHIVVRAIEVSACFDATPKKGEAPLTVIFDPDCSTGTITSYNWTFADGESSSDVKPNHTFDTPGIYSVELEVLDDNNTVSTKTVEIQVSAPEAEE
jgi:PKD repeat protein